MKQVLPLLALATVLAAPLVVRAQGIPLNAATPQGFADSNFRLVPGSLASGDLNGDGRPDAAMVLLKVGGFRDAAAAAAAAAQPVRTLLVAWGKAGGGYRLGLTADEAVLCPTCGGLLGDPFEKLTIAKGILSIVHRGGSRERWKLTAKFRYQQGDFYQIGETYDVLDDAGRPCPKLGGAYRSGSEHRDENLVTGSFERVSVSADCQFAENKRGKQPVKPLVRLLDYKPQP